MRFFDSTYNTSLFPSIVHCLWLPFFLYLLCTDLSPQDSILLPDIVEVDRLPSFKREDGEMWYAFYILTCHGIRYECSSNSKIQVLMVINFAEWVQIGMYYISSQ
ncbi:hypothetical protein TanjilG_01944 [Lupinus angustifolius]|nr:hypothetical protein TanjilG_01944 [Lupinus angustifolius]